MPALLTAEQVDLWLGASSPATLVSLLQPAPADALCATPVSSRVNSVRNDDPACLAAPEPEPSAPLPHQLRLLDD
jgi:putative SOS response-associated peptidase YedK